MCWFSERNRSVDCALGSRDRQAAERVLQAWLKQPGRRIVLHFIPPYCPHLNPIERLWAVMHQNVTHNRYHATFKDCADAILTFLKQTLPKHFHRFSDRITDNFHVFDLKEFRVLAS